MKKLLVGTALLFMASAGFTSSATVCSSATGELRMTKIKGDGSKKIRWFYNGDKYHDSAVDAKLDLDDDKMKIITGDEYNGHFTTTADFEHKQSDIELKNVRMLCQTTHTEKVKARSIELPMRKATDSLDSNVVCSSPNGNVTKENSSHGNIWKLNGAAIPETSSVVFNASVNLSVADSTIYQVTITSVDGQEVPAEFIICQ